MRLYLLALLLVGLLAFGCLGSQAPPAPDYRPPSGLPAAPAPVVHKPQPAVNNSTPIVPPIGPKNGTAASNHTATNATRPVNATSNSSSNATKPSPNANGSINASNATAPAPPVPTVYCAGSSSSDALSCLTNASIQAKDVQICAQLTLTQDRAQCITSWCHSSARDLNACSRLTNIDNRLSCIQKCSPNFNS